MSLLEKLPESEWRLLEKWVASPLHNTRSDVEALLRHIAVNRHKNPNGLIKATAFTAIYPNEPYNDLRMNHLMSWLLGQVRNFLAWREADEDEPYQRLLRTRALRRLGADKGQIDKEWQHGRTALEAGPYRDEHYHYLAHLYERERYEYAVRTRRQAAPLAALARHAELAYRLNRLRYECNAEAGQVVGGDHDGSGEKIILENEPTIRLYEQLLQALREPANEAAFFEARHLLEEHWPLFRSQERRDLYLLALNFCIRKINGGARQFMREAFELYRSGLANRALFEHDVLSPFTYKNAVTAGLALGEFDWVGNFLEEYRPYLPPRERHNTYIYNLAVYHFRRPDYDRAMQLLREADFTDVLTNLDARSMLLRIYYERGFHDALESLLDSFQSYLRRQKNIGYQRDSYSNLLRFVRRLLRVTDAEEKAALRREVEQTAALAERSWLLERLA
jgi:hypothetical protein